MITQFAARASWTSRSQAEWKHVTQGAAWQRLERRLGIRGHVIALEFMGDENGSRPHYHVLVVHHLELGAAAIAALHADIHTRLAAACADAGLRQPDQLHAVRIDANVSASAQARTSPEAASGHPPTR
jgi:hypothetical protein